MREKGDSIIVLPSRFRYNVIFDFIKAEFAVIFYLTILVQVSSSYYYNFYLFVKKIVILKEYYKSSCKKDI